MQQGEESFWMPPPPHFLVRIMKKSFKNTRPIPRSRSLRYAEGVLIQEEQVKELRAAGKLSIFLMVVERVFFIGL